MDTYGWCFSMGLLLDTVQATLGHIIIGPMFDPVITALVLWYWTNGMRYYCWSWAIWMWTHGVDISHVLVLTNVALICDHDGDDFKAYQMGQFQACWWLSDQPQKHLRQLGLIIAAPVDTNTSISMIRVYYIYIEIVYSINIYNLYNYN
jgi:hypothetical protein